MGRVHVQIQWGMIHKRESVCMCVMAIWEKLITHILTLCVTCFSHEYREILS